MDFFWVPPGYKDALPYDSVSVILKMNAGRYISVDNSFEKLRVVPLSETMATYTGLLRSTMTDTTGNVSTFSMVETAIVIKRKDGWKLLNGQTTILSQ